MKKVSIKRDWLIRAKQRARLNPEELEKVESYAPKSNIHSFDAAFDELPREIWSEMLNDSKLTSKPRAMIALFVFGMGASEMDLESIYELEVADPVEFGSTLQIVGGRQPNCEISINDRWYPAIVLCEFLEDQDKIARGIQLTCTLGFGTRNFSISYGVRQALFRDESGDRVPRKVIDVLESLGFRRLQTSSTEYNLRLMNSERLSAEASKVVLVTGGVIKPSRMWWMDFEKHSLGTNEMPSRCIIEPILESQRDERGYFGGGRVSDESVTRVPFVRLFCLETKDYVFADIDDIQEYDFDEQALSRLHLPDDMHSILSRVFSTPIDQMFGDLLKGKHGGVVVLASGEPGVGKTLTAEIYAESTQRPLYVMELGELGTNAESVEANLQQVFTRVTRWNAVLQFDECEIFLASRGNDLERSAIVGIFLRLLDYYRGLLFLTTNRPEVLDTAVLSRVMLRLAYPHLDEPTRAKIWSTMFKVAGLATTGFTFEELAKLDLNGRQIRNLTRLAKILHSDGVVSAKGIGECLQFGAGLKMP